MSRDLGEFVPLEPLPDAVVVVAAVVTQLGDVWFLFLFLGVVYWAGERLPGPLALDRRQGAVAIAIGVGGLALVTALKAVFELPRPPGALDPGGVELVPELLRPLYVEAATSDGHGFPSGHALSTTVVFGGVALLVGGRRPAAIAATLVAVVSLSRVVLGVHYLVDVIVGVAAGGIFLAAVYRLGGLDSPARVLTVGLAVSLVGVADGYTFDTMAALGATLGGLLAWTIVGGAVVRAPATRPGAVLATAAGLVSAGIFVAVSAGNAAPHLAFLGVGAAVAGAFAAPVVGESTARRLAG